MKKTGCGLIVIDEKKEYEHVKEAQQESIMLSEPKSSAKTPMKVIPWSSRLSSPNASPNVSIGITIKHVNSTQGKDKMDQPMVFFYVLGRHCIANHDLSGRDLPALIEKHRCKDFVEERKMAVC